jgi:serine/threonine protein kinase
VILSQQSLVRGFGLFLPESPGESAVILMQNCSSGSPAESIEKGSLTATQKNKVIVSLTKGRAFLHEEQKILHRGLKQSNVMFDGVGNAFIGDFRAARVIELGITQTRAAQTPFYGAPELHRDSEASGVEADDLRDAREGAAV